MEVCRWKWNMKTDLDVNIAKNDRTGLLYPTNIESNSALNMLE